MTEQEYRKYNAVNYSTLSALDKNPKSLIDEKDFSDAMKMGDAVDTLLFSPDNFNNKYQVADVQTPTGQLLELAQHCNENNIYTEEGISSIVNEITNNKFNYFGSVKKEDKRNAKWNNNLFLDYLKFLQRSKDKHVISIEEYDKIRSASNILRTHEFTKDIFDKGYSQYPIIFEYKGIEYKGLLDLIIFDGKTIYPYDLKCVGDSVYSFKNKIYRFRYDIQSSLYKHGLEILFPDYEVKDFKDIVYSFPTEKVLIYNMRNFYEESKHGYYHNDNYYKGWLKLTDDLFWHDKMKLYEYKREEYENNGEIII